MKIIDTELNDAFIIEPIVFGDNRGWFFESYSKEKIKKIFTGDFIQDNHSFSNQKGVLRGLHFQLNPKAQAKLVRCTRGEIYDVIVDLRRSSSTYLKWIKVKLTETNKRQLLIPKGFAHGFLTLTENVEVQYKVDEFYSQEHDRSIKWNDPLFGIDWDISNPILSKKDKEAKSYQEMEVDF